MDNIQTFLLCSIAFTVTSALPQYSTAVPQYSTGVPQYSTAAPQYSQPQYTPSQPPQYPPPQQQYTPSQPQYTASQQPQYNPSQQQQYSPSQPPYNQYQTTPVPIISQSQELNPDGSYHYGYKTGNGIAAEERGAIKNLGSPENEINAVQGYFSYPGLDGNQYTLTYTADENGFVPHGDHLPTPPPVPAELIKAYEALPPDNNEYDDKGFPIRQGQQQGFAGSSSGRV